MTEAGSSQYEESDRHGLVTIIYALTNAEVRDQDRRGSLFEGHLFVYAPRPSTLALSSVTRRILEHQFGPDPALAQQRMSESAFAEHFDAAARGLNLVVLEMASAIVADFGGDRATTFVGSPTLVATTGHGFLAQGLGSVQHPHRDTWYAASPCQVNWWIPLYDSDASASFAFHVQHWNSPVRNTSSEFRFARWYEEHQMGRSVTWRDTFADPRPVDPIELSPELRIACQAGGTILSSVSQLYSVVPNETLKTHFSVQFRTVSEGDLVAGFGAADPDAAVQETSLASFVRCSDLTPIPPLLIERELSQRTPVTRQRRQM
jgi:hypothetical protein